MVSPPGTFRLSRFPAFAAALLVAGIGVAGLLHLRSEQRRFRAQVEAQLSAIADLKVSQIAAWRHERLADAAVLTENPLIAQQLKALFRSSRPSAVERECRAWLDALASHERYAAAVLVDGSGRTLATAGRAPPPLSHAARHFAEALRERRALLTELEMDEETGRVHVDVIAPLFDPDRPGVPLGGLLLRVDPADELYPLIQRWPTPSASAEALLVRVDGGSILFLNELRHRRGPPLSLRVPMDERTLPAVRFALGEQDVITGIDYRGAKVLAAGRPVPGSRWLLVAKMDLQELLAPARTQAVRLALLVLLLMGSAVGSIALWWRHQAALLERARYEEARAREAHARHLELLSEHADDAVMMVDDGGRIVRANARVQEQYGWSSAELVGFHLRALRAPGHAEGLDAQIERLRREGRLRYETVHRRRDGTTLQVEVSARGFEAEGRWFFQAIVRDVSERKQELRTISYQAELLRNLYDAVIGLDSDQVIRSWNPAAERIYGFAAHEVIGRRISEVLPSEYKGYTYSEFVAALDRLGQLKFEVRRALRTGASVDVEGHAVVLRADDGRITGYVTVNRDISVRRRAEAALRASQERLARILETSSEGIWIVDVRGTTEFVNERAATLFDATPDGLLGRGLLDVTPELGRARARADLEAVSRGESVKREFVMRRPGGSDVWINVSWSALRDPDGRVVGAVGLFMDVTEHRRAREQLLQAQKMDAVGRLASGIAHDFNNLLVSILSCSSFLLESFDEGDPRREEAQEIKGAGERAAQLVRQLLTFARKSAFRPSAVDLSTVVRRVDTILRRAIGEHVTLSIALETAPWPTRIDPGQLEQVLVNLALNAQDAMPKGGELHIQTSNVTLERPPADAEELAPGRYAVLTVADTGCGIGDEVLPNIFEPFFTTKPEGRGTGLGLSTVYGIVRDAGGHVAVSSTPGRGTTFKVYLPACDADPKQDASPVQAQAPATRRHDETILVVEDEDAVRRSVRRMLEASGYHVLDVNSGAAALQHVQADGPIDLVLTDVVMPQMSGTELAAAVGALRPELPVVLMSGYSERFVSADAAEQVLEKPFTADALVARVHEALRMRPQASS